MSSERPPVVDVFFSYAHADKALRDKLEDHLANLKYRRLISTWHDREISAGNEWAQQIDIHLNTAHIILLLISSNFMASEYCYSIEMKRAIERHELGEARVIPILLRPVLFTGAPFAQLQMLPTNAKPVVNWRNRDSAFVDIARGIERVVTLNFIPRRSKEEILESFERLSPEERQAIIDEFNQQAILPLPSSSSINLLPPTIMSFFSGVITAGILLLLHSNLILTVAITLLVMLLTAVISTPLLRIREIRKRRRETPGQDERQAENFFEAMRRPQEADEKTEREVYYKETLAAYEQALLLNAHDADALRGIGNVLYSLERYDEALEAFKKAVLLDPKPSIYSSMGNTLCALDHFSEAVAAFELALDLDPTVTLDYERVYYAFLQLGRAQEADQIREKAKQLGYED